MKNTGRMPLNFLRRIAPVICLFFLAPLFGEYLLGNLKFSELIYVPFIAPLYGCGAILIREITRRTGRSYSTMLILGIAYGLIEEGLVDQMLFNRLYAGHDQMSATYITALGLDVWLTIVVLAMHAIWSTCIPIILIEALFPERGTEPWLGKAGLTVTAAIFFLGSVYLCHTVSLEEKFFASVPQLAATTAVIAIVAALAFTTRRCAPAESPSGAPKPWLMGVASFASSSLFMLAADLPGWSKAGACLLLVIIFFSMLRIWSHQAGWGAMHNLAVAGGAILTYAWVGVGMEPQSGPKTTMDHIGSGLFAAGAVLLLVLALYRTYYQKIDKEHSHE